MNTNAQTLIERLNLAPHPEGGWYRETIREGSDGARATVTAIYYLLEAGQRSHWHRVDAAEIWLWHAGSSLALGIEREVIRLGPDMLNGEAPQALVAAGAWQSAEADRGWALVSCVVAPGFDFAGFEMAPQGWSPPA